MSDLAVRVEGLSKQYRIGGPQARYQTIRESITEAAKSPFRRAARLLRGQAYGAAGLEETIWALKDVSFEIKEGEVVGIIGRNGAGKTTLLKILSRITEPTEGQVDLYGRVGSLLEVGTGFHPELTGRENVYLNGAILGMKRVEIDRKFDEIVAFAETEKFLDTPVKHYSSGMYVRLAFAVAAHMEPEILVVDEVLAVGDAKFQKKCLSRMGEVAQGGKTVLFVSHNMGAVASLCHRSMLFLDGQIATEGDTSDVIAKYLHDPDANNSNDGHIDLRSWSRDRRGAGPMRLDYLDILDPDGSYASRFAYGDSICFRFGVLNGINEDCIVGVSIRDSSGRLIYHLTNLDDDASLRMGKNPSIVTVCIPQITLNDGVYHVSVWLGDGFNILHDRVGDCLTFAVDSIADGAIRSRAPVRMRAEWKQG